MTDNENNFVIRCANPNEIVAVLNVLMPNIPKAVRRQVNHFMLHYLAAEGEEGLFQRVNGRTVTELIEAAGKLQAANIVAEGERDGMKFTLYDPPNAE